MDTVRFGRVLGHGARQAAKTLVSAVDAATAPNPNPTPTAPGPPAANPPAAKQTVSPPSPSAQPVPRAATAPAKPQPRQPVITVLPAAAQRTRPVANTTRGLAEGSRRFGRAVWAPAVRLSGVLWLELTGVFFGLFALIAAIASWRLRAAVHAAPAGIASEDRTRFFFAVGMVVVFGYFSLSSFIKANRRSRKP